MTELLIYLIVTIIGVVISITYNVYIYCITMNSSEETYVALV